MPGPPRKPTKLKLLAGNPGHQKLRPEPEPELGIRTCPKYLPPLAKKQWKHLVHHLDSLNLLTKVDAAVLEGVCVAYARAVAADQILDFEGLTVEDQGKISARPEVVISHNCWLRVKSFATEFGLTPASRGKLAAATGKKDDDLDVLLAG